jgi:hypothetical protein
MVTPNTLIIQARNGINGIVTLILLKPNIPRVIIHTIRDILDIMVIVGSIPSLNINLTTGTIPSLIVLTVHSNIQLPMLLRNIHQSQRPRMTKTNQSPPTLSPLQTHGILSSTNTLTRILTGADSTLTITTITEDGATFIGVDQQHQ